MRANSKLIVNLIRRVEVRLPLNNSGRSIESLEQDPITQQTVAAIIEISAHKLSIVINQLGLVLETISKNVQQPTSPSSDPYIPFDVLQSQLFILRLISACLQHHSACYKKDTPPPSDTTTTTPNTIHDNTDGEPLERKVTQNSRTSVDQLNGPPDLTSSPNQQVPPLEEALANYLLSLLTKYLVQMHIIEERNDQLTVTSSEHGNDALATASSKGDSQTMEYVREVYNTAGKIMNYISASNWPIYYARIKNAVNVLSSINNDNSDFNPPDVRLLSFASLDVAKLHTVLQELSHYFLNMRPQGKLLFGKMMRTAIWRWIETKPHQFAKICASDNRSLAGSEVLFDLCTGAAESSRKKAILWPLQTILLTLSPDILLQAFLDDRGVQNRRTAFPQQLKKALQSARTQEIATMCYVDLSKAATYISPKEEDSILRHIAADVENVLKEKIWNFSRSNSVDSLTSSLGYTVSHQSLVTDYILSSIRLDSKKFFDMATTSLMAEETPIIFKHAFISTCVKIATDENPMPWCPTIKQLYPFMCQILRRIFVQIAKAEMSAPVARSDISSATSGSRKTGNGSGDKTLFRIQNSEGALRCILKLFRLDPLTALKGENVQAEEIIPVFTALTNLLKHNDKRMRLAVTDCILKLHDTHIIYHWGTSEMLISNFWKVSSQVTMLLSRQIMDVRQNEEGLKNSLEILSKVLASRNSFLAETTEVYHEPMESHDRLQASVLLEVALLVSLCSPIPDIGSLTTTCLRLMCAESKMVDEEIESQQSIMTFSHNIEIYEDLSYEEPIVQGLRKQPFVGRKAQQKRIRKYLRMMTSPTPGILNAWEEVWRRWKILTQVVSRFGMDSLRDPYEQLQHQQQLQQQQQQQINSPVKKIGGLVRHERLRNSTVKAAPVPVARIETDDEKQTEWQNYTGFLAALGGSRLMNDLDDDMSDDGKRRGASDRMSISSATSSMSNPFSLADRFVREMVELLTSENVIIRESVKETLGSNLSPALYPVLFRHLESAMSSCFNINGEVFREANNTLFVEQAVLVLKMILDRLTDPSDCLLSVDFSTLVLKFANYINKLPHDNYTAMRIMIMMCHLTEALMSRKEQVIVRDDVRVRNKLLEIIVEWTSDFTLRSTNKTAAKSTSPNKEIQLDLDQSCLKAIGTIVHKLPLQSSDQNRDNTDRYQSKNRLFQKYFTFFTQILDRCHRYEAESTLSINSDANIALPRQRELHHLSIKPADSYQYWGPLKDTAVTALSNLLSANVDAGLKSSLAMGYHEDARTRTAFMQVMTNILNEGAEFDTLAENIVTERYDKLVELVVESDIEVALSLCTVCPSGDAAGVAEVLLHTFESRNKVLVLLKSLIEREVYSTEQESTLFRGTTMTTRLLSIFARRICVDYIRLTLQPAMEAINALPEDQLTWEMDPQKIGPNESVQKNKQNVCHATGIFLDAICASASSAPKLFRKQLSFIVEAVNKRFPDASKTSVGGFVFLRLFNPAILTPETSGFSKQALPKSKNTRKLLLQATRMMQNLANNIMFGARETHLISLNDFITANLYRVANFLREISLSSPGMDATEVKASTRGVRMDPTAYASLHRYLSDNLDRISRELSVRRSRTSDDTQKMLELKRTMDKLSNLLAQLGPPSEQAHKEFNAARNYALVNTNNHYSEFIRRNKHRDLSYINSLNIFYKGGVSRGGRPVFYVISRHVRGENFDFELLVYYMLRVMEPFLNHPFELLFDLSCFGEDNEIPVHWLAQFFQLVFSELNDYLVTLLLFNPNFHMQRYIRKLPRKLTNKLVKRTRFAITISDLDDYISPSEVKLPKQTYEIEKEMGMVIKSGYLVSNFKNLIPVKIKIGSEHLQVLTIREQEIFWSLNTVLNNVFYMTDLVDIFLPAIPPSKKSPTEGEIHISYDSGKSTLILLVPNREEVHKFLLQRKENFDSNIKPENHGIRPADVPGRILNMALLNIGSEDPGLRLAAYHLLYSLSISFRFSVAHQLMSARDLCIPFNSVDFTRRISENLAASEAHLTLEFLNECIVGYNRSSTESARQLLTLEYMVPWLRNLVLFIHMPVKKEASKVKDVIRSLIVITAEKSEAYQHIQKNIWKTLGQVEELHNLVLECMIQYCVENGIGSEQAESVADTIVTMACNSIRGKIISRTRRVLQGTSQNCCVTLVKHPAWVEIACLIRFLLMISFYSDDIEKPYVAELFHIVSLVLSNGPTLIRSSVHELVVNTIHALVTNKSIDSENRKKLKYVLDDVCDGKYRVHFGLNKSYANSFTITEETMSDNIEFVSLSSLEIIVKLLMEAIKYAAPNLDVANTWRARWMSLVTSMTFQFNPALQSRSFVILGCLSQDEIDDDLLFQILVVLKNDLVRFDESNPHLIVSILMCLTNIIDSLPATSRYIKPIFWMAISLIEMNHMVIFPYAVNLLHTILRTLDTHKCFDYNSMESVLMEAREPYDPIADEIDKKIGLSFKTQFSFAVAGILLRGFKHADARDAVFMCLTTFLEIESKNAPHPNMIDHTCLGYLCGLLPFAAKNDVLRELLRLAGIAEIEAENIDTKWDIYSKIWRVIDIPNNTNGILLVSFLVGMLSLAENEVERLFLYGFLSRAAVSTPEVFALVYDSLVPKMNEIVVKSEHVALIEAVKDILLTACHEPAFHSSEKALQHKRCLDEIGFSALGETNFGSMNTSTVISAELASDLLQMLCEK